jgi:hypothetical protein
LRKGNDIEATELGLVPELAEGHSQNLSLGIKEEIVFPFSKDRQYRDF